MRLFVFYVLVFVVSLSCERTLELRSVVIQKIELRTFPLSDTLGNSWDMATAQDSLYADLFISITSGDTASNVHFSLRTIISLNNPGVTAIYDQNFPFTIDDPMQVYTYGLYDSDSLTVDAQYMSSMSFSFSRYKSLSPSILDLSNGQISLRFHLDWQYETVN